MTYEVSFGYRCNASGIENPQIQGMINMVTSAAFVRHIKKSTEKDV